jgi:hypothetical protein
MIDMTVKQLFEQLDKWGAAQSMIVLRDKDDVPIKAIIVVSGIPETGEIVEAVEKITSSWDEDEERSDAAL